MIDAADVARTRPMTDHFVITDIKSVFALREAFFLLLQSGQVGELPDHFWDPWDPWDPRAKFAILY